MEEITTTQEIENALINEFSQYGNFASLQDIFPEEMEHSAVIKQCVIQAFKQLCASKHGEGYCFGYQTAKGDIGTQDELPL
jgi:hypothetical protein